MATFSFRSLFEAADSWFSHIAVEVLGEEASTKWLEPVGHEAYGKLAG